MARTPISATAQLATTTLTTIYTTPAGINTSSTVLTLTNASTVTLSVDIYIGNGTDFLQTTLSVPAGIGRKRSYYDLGNITTANTVKIQADSASAFNYNFSGSEIEI